MKLLVVKPHRESTVDQERILDTETGLVYDKQDSHPSGLTLEEARAENRHFTVVWVSSLHTQNNEFGTTAISYEGKAADLLWRILKDNAVLVNPDTPEPEALRGLDKAAQYAKPPAHWDDEIPY